MAIEIRELYIKAVVDAGGEGKTGGAGSEAVADTSGQNDGNTEQLIEFCIEKVLEILKEKKER